MGPLTLEFISYTLSPDGYGMHLCFVSFQRLIPEEYWLSQILGPIGWLYDPLFNNFTRTINKLPGNRIFFYTITSYLATFDRLQFYYYHDHELTQYSELLLSNANELAVERGSLPQYLV